ncbi:MAG: endonuclease/exonuclease/phosphatase family protein [Cyanobacteria bacterium J06555_13]
MDSFTVTTWNVENLMQPEASDADKVETFRQKISLLAGVIGQLNPDVIGFQEVGSEAALLDLQQALGNDYPHHAVSNFPDRRGIRVAYLSKWDITEQEDIVDFPEGPALKINGLTPAGDMKPYVRMGRGALRIQVKQGEFAVDVINTHLKSKLLTFKSPDGRTRFQPKDETERVQVAGIAVLRRTAEAVTVRSRINERLVGNAHRPLILLGDLNDVPEAQTSLILNGPPGSEIGTGGFARPDKGDDARLFNLSTLIPEERRFSRVYRGKGELLDQVLASVELFPTDGKTRRLPKVDSYVDFADQLPSITDDPSKRRDKAAPDHAPITAVFQIG